jgi:hypothetical protein
LRSKVLLDVIVIFGDVCCGASSSKGMKASNRNMLYMCESRCILGPWEGGLRLDEQPLDELYELTVPHWKSVLFEHEVLQVADIPDGGQQHHSEWHIGARRARRGDARARIVVEQARSMCVCCPVNST